MIRPHELVEDAIDRAPPEVPLVGFITCALATAMAVYDLGDEAPDFGYLDTITVRDDLVELIVVEGNIFRVGVWPSH